MGEAFPNIGQSSPHIGGVMQKIGRAVPNLIGGLPHGHCPPAAPAGRWLMVRCKLFQVHGGIHR